MQSGALQGGGAWVGLGGAARGRGYRFTVPRPLGWSQPYCTARGFPTISCVLDMPTELPLDISRYCRQDSDGLCT